MEFERCPEGGQAQGAVGSPKRDSYTSLEISPKDNHSLEFAEWESWGSSWRRGSRLFQVGISCPKTWTNENPMATIDLQGLQFGRVGSGHRELG